MKILITGSGGLLGTAISQGLEQDFELLTPRRIELDLRNSEATQRYIDKNSPDLVIHCAAKVGGIAANINFPADHILENTQIDSSILAASRSAKVPSLIYLGSSCMYPKDYRQPLKETDLMGGPLEDTNKGYALAKLSGAMTTEAVAEQDSLAWRVLILSNIYGPGDHFDSDASHLLAAIVNKFASARKNGISEIDIWGSGNSRREFTYVEDVAKFISTKISQIDKWPKMMNLGAGEDFSVLEYYNFVAKTFGIDPNYSFDKSRPEGMVQKLMDSSIANSHGWNPETKINEGIARTVKWYLDSRNG